MTGESNAAQVDINLLLEGMTDHDLQRMWSEAREADDYSYAAEIESVRCARFAPSIGQQVTAASIEA